MAEWSVKPTWKKSIIERQHMTKDGNEIIIETGWRWGEFTVYTEDDNPPKIEAGVDMFDCGYESEMIETSDGCWEEHDFDECDDETREWLEEFFEEGNSYFDLEEHGWIFDDCEMIIDCDLEIRKLLDDGTYSDPVEVDMSEDEEIVETPEVKLEPNAKWPFGPSDKDKE